MQINSQRVTAADYQFFIWAVFEKTQRMQNKKRIYFEWWYIFYSSLRVFNSCFHTNSNGVWRWDKRDGVQCNRTKQRWCVWALKLTRRSGTVKPLKICFLSSWIHIKRHASEIWLKKYCEIVLDHLVACEIFFTALLVLDSGCIPILEQRFDVPQVLGEVTLKTVLFLFFFLVRAWEKYW